MAYLKYMTTVVILLQGGNESNTRKQMKEVLKFEMKLAKVCVQDCKQLKILECATSV